jgi:PAS domain S-box-containing protein
MDYSPLSWFHKVLSGPDFHDEAKKRTAGALKGVLLALLAVVVTYSLITPFVDLSPALALAANGSLSLLYIGLFFLIRQGWVESHRHLQARAQALQEGKEQLYLALDAAQMGTWNWDIKTNGVTWSERAEMIFGLQKDEFEGAFGAYRSRVYLEDWPGVEQRISEVLSGKMQRYQTRHRIIWPDGGLHWIEGRGQLYRDKAGNPIGMTGTVQDITEHKLIETELQQARDTAEATSDTLRQREAYLRSILNNMPFLMWLKDLEGRFLMINEAAARSFSVPDTTWLIGKTDLDLAPPELAEKYRADDQIVIETKSQRFIEEPIVNLNGQRWFATYKTPILDEKGQVLGTTGFALDITERREAEKVLKEYSARLEEMVEERTRELQDAQERLIRQEKLAFLGQLAGGVGHELRNPLGVITNAVYFLQLVLTEANEIVKEYLEIITSRVQEAEKIVSDLLNLSRNRVADRREITSQQLVEEVLARQPAPKGVTVTVELPTDLPPLFVDPQQIKQVLTNLISNAYQALPNGGEVTVTAQTHSNGVSLSLADTGPGMPAEMIAKIFEPLFTTKAKGIGLGLAVSKNLVEINSGKIEVESVEGQGSIFSLILPTETFHEIDISYSEL